MEKSDIRYSTYIRILKEELVPAMGCTEPIAIAYCAARTRDLLDGLPDSCLVEASGNIIKNVKSVVVPNVDGLRGIGGQAGGHESSVRLPAQRNPAQPGDILKTG